MRKVTMVILVPQTYLMCSQSESVSSSYGQIRPIEIHIEMAS